MTRRGRHPVPFEEPEVLFVYEEDLARATTDTEKPSVGSRVEVVQEHSNAMQSGRRVQPRILQPFSSRCLGASEDSLLAQLSSRVSVVSGAGRASTPAPAAAAAAQEKLRKYAPGEAMSPEAQLQANVLLASGEKTAAAGQCGGGAGPDLSAFDDVTPIKPAPCKTPKADGRRPLRGIAFQRRGAARSCTERGGAQRRGAGRGGEERDEMRPRRPGCTPEVGRRSLYKTAAPRRASHHIAPRGVRARRRPLRQRCASATPFVPRGRILLASLPCLLMCLKFIKKALNSLRGKKSRSSPKSDADKPDDTMVKMLMRADTHIDLEITGVADNRPSFSWSQVFASVSVSIGSMIVGFSSAYTSPALVSMMLPNSTLLVTTQQASWIGSLMPLSALIGGMAGGLFIEWIGRRATILATAIPFIVSWLLIGMAVTVPMVYAGRVVAGFCVGVTSLCLPVYMGETIQPEVRGMLGLISTTLGNIGILVCFLAGKYLNWSNLAFFGAMIPVPFLLCTLFIPETPRWYISKEKHEAASKSLKWLRGGQHVDVSEELSEIEKNHRDAVKNAPVSIGELFNKGNLKPIFISISLMFFQQLSGINAVIFYTVKIFQGAGSTIDENLSTIVVGIVNLGSTFLATVLIDRLGRRVLLGISAVAMSVSLAVLGTFFYLRTIQVDVSDYGWLPLLSFVVFVIGFSLGFGPIPWLMLGEIFPAKIRGPAASLATAFNWACTFLVTKTFNDLEEALGGYGAFWMFGVVCFISLFFVIFCVPETQGRSLEDIEKNFKGKVRRMSSITNIKPTPMAV
ncbi:Gastric caeca sugar transporter [Gryllus bimaculatus]|nr:Gastric caeca sugar transporter [Gryllus bimaculatus]